LRMEEYLRFWH